MVPVVGWVGLQMGRGSHGGSAQNTETETCDICEHRHPIAAKVFNDVYQSEREEKVAR